jgi:hypothetical protein
MRSGLTAIRMTTKPGIKMKERPPAEAALLGFRFKCSAANSKSRTAATASGVCDSRRRQRSIYEEIGMLLPVLIQQ